MKIDEICVCGARYQLDTAKVEDTEHLIPAYHVWKRIHAQCDDVQELARLTRWIEDLQQGLWINCVYCGHRYGPQDREVPQDMLRRHVASCPKHPLAHLIMSCEAILNTLKQAHAEGAQLTMAEKLIFADLTEAVKRARA